MLQNFRPESPTGVSGEDLSSSLPSPKAIEPRGNLASSLLWQAVLPVLCMGAGLLAHDHDRPVTAAMAFMLAVIAIALRGGVRLGLLAGILVSAIYNFLLSEPTLSFSLSSLDDLVPLIAFNVSAVAAAYLTGRLRDEASASAAARQRLSATLRLSEKLQTAVDIDAILSAVLESAPEARRVWVELEDGRRFSAPKQSLMQTEERPTVQERFQGGNVRAVLNGGANLLPESQLKLAALALERWALTERLTEADVLRQSEAFKTALLSSVSHDLRTPLAVISASAGSLRHLGDHIARDEQEGLLETIEEQARRLDVLTGKLLSLGRIEGGLKTANMPQVDALELLGAALRQARQAHPHRRIEKSYELSTALVRADPALLEQALFNVVENAAVHTPESLAIYISVSRAGSDCVISVEDEGQGVAATQRELIFERFTQLSNGNAAGGSGLGLAIARGFVRAVGGELVVSERENGEPGCCFTIRIPLEG